MDAAPREERGESVFRRAGLARFCLAAMLLGLGLAGLWSVRAQVVTTLAGGRKGAVNAPDYGYTDGDSLGVVQFHDPSGLALLPGGDLLVADRSNGALRKMSLSLGLTSTLTRESTAPVDTAVDSAGSIYILDRSSGMILKHDKFDAQFKFPTTVARGLRSPNAMALDADGNIWVVEDAGVLRRIAGTNIVDLATGFIQPKGVEVTQGGLIVVSDTGRNQIKLLNPNSGAVVTTIGAGAAGFRDGPIGVAQFNQPHGLAVAPNGSLVVADRLNHRVRLVAPDGIVTTLYGVDPTLWEGPCLTCVPLILPGWYDGTPSRIDTVEAREPVGVVVNAAGTVFVTEGYYHIVRSLSGVDLVSGGTSGGGSSTNALVLAPTLRLLPSGSTNLAGYYPAGVVVEVSDPNADPLGVTRVYYTTDGSEPGPSNSASQLVGMTAGLGRISWRELTRDLSSLRVRILQGNTASTMVSGSAAATNTVGFATSVEGGSGSTVLLPVVANLKPGVTLKSAQFRIEATPVGAAPALKIPLRALAVQPGDFISLVGASTNAPITRADSGSGAGALGIAYIGTNSAFTVQNFAAICMVAVAIPGNALEGQMYRVQATSVSGTSDGLDAKVVLTNLPAVLVTVRSRSYGVGDCSPALGYNAGDFGDDLLQNNDVNSAFYGSLGVRLPPTYTDVFDAMDSFPEDSVDAVGGDGRIRFLDWQILLDRALGFRTNNWRRAWVHGQREAVGWSGSGAASSPGTEIQAQPALRVARYVPSAILRAGVVSNARPGQTISVPLDLEFQDGATVTGVQFRASVLPLDGGPALSAAVMFDPASAIPTPLVAGGLDVSEYAGAWSLLVNPLPQPAGKIQRLGNLKISVPVGATAGSRYVVRLSGVDGARDLATPRDVLGASGAVGVLAAASADAPVPPVRLLLSNLAGAGSQLESTDDLGFGSWQSEGEPIAARSGVVEVLAQPKAGGARFYRLRLFE